MDFSQSGFLHKTDIMRVYSLLLLLAICAGCSHEQQPANKDNAAPTYARIEFAPPPAPGATMNDDASLLRDMQKTVPQSAPALIEKKIIREGDLEIRSGSLAASKRALDSLVRFLHGYYQTENYSKSSHTTSYELSVRIPAAEVDQFLKLLSQGKDEIISKNMSATDVTEDYTDIALRLDNKRRFLQRYHELLAKGTVVKDILAIQEQIRNLEEEIEAAEGKLRYYDHEVGYAKLDIRLFEEHLFVEHDEGFLRKLAKRFVDGGRYGTDLILTMVANWPLIIILSLLAIAAKKWWRRRKG